MNIQTGLTRGDRITQNPYKYQIVVVQEYLFICWVKRSICKFLEFYWNNWNLLLASTAQRSYWGKRFWGFLTVYCFLNSPKVPAASSCAGEAQGISPGACVAWGCSPHTALFGMTSRTHRAININKTLSGSSAARVHVMLSVHPPGGARAVM